MHKNASKGFTLIELVVVIAIIAVLAAVIVPAVGAMMDRSRLSNDNQTATRMTQAMAWVATEEGLDLEKQTPHDIRNMLRRFDDETFSLVTTSENSAYFYDVDLERIVALRYADVPGDDEPAKIPEAVFSSRYLLLTNHGDAVTEVVYGIRNNMAHQTLSERALMSAHAIRLEALLELFNPAHTVYVDHHTWTTDAMSAEAIKQWLFAPGLSHLPQYDLPFAVGGEFRVPYSVKTIAEHAFIYDDGTSTQAFETIIMDEHQRVKMHDDAMLESQTLQGGNVQAYAEPSWNPLNGTPVITSFEGSMSLDLSQIDPNFRMRIVATDIVQNGTNVYVDFFTDRGFEARWSEAE